MKTKQQAIDRRIVLAAQEVPSEGGASTSAYSLFRKMRACDLDVHLVNVIDLELYDYYLYVFGECMGNPDGLENVHNCIVDQRQFQQQPERTALPSLLADIAPEVALGVDSTPALMLKRSMPQVPVIFLACGCEQAFLHVGRFGTRNAENLQRKMRPRVYPPELFNSPEVRAIQSCDLLIANSDLTRDLFGFFYPSFTGKIALQPVWFAEWICEHAAQFADLAKPFPDREIDLLFIASSWLRDVKNWPLAHQVISDCRELETWVVGKLDRASPHAHCPGFVENRRELFELMGNARTVVSTSRLDTAPGVLFEAAVMGCNVVASRNCGNWKLCHPDLLVERYGRREFAANCRKATERKYEDRLSDFLAQGSYLDLLDSVAVL